MSGHAKAAEITPLIGQTAASVEEYRVSAISGANDGLTGNILSLVHDREDFQKLPCYLQFITHCIGRDSKQLMN